jgi:acyl carrier protein
MSGNPSVVDNQQLGEQVRRIIAEVLVTSLEEVQPGRALVRDLGAESLDFLDLVFRLEDVLGRKIPFARWQHFLEVELEAQDLAVAITPEVVQRFAEQEAARA